MKHFLKSPAHYKSWLETPSESTPALNFGRDLHCYVLERDLFESSYIEAISVDRRTKAGKAEWAEFQAMAKDKTIISPDDQQLIKTMDEALRSHAVANSLLYASKGENEREIYWKNQVYGFGCKCKPDRINFDFDITIDLKTAEDASPKGFAKSAANYGYDIQAAWYPSGIHTLYPGRFQQFVFVVIEKKPPHCIGIYRASDEMVMSGQAKIRDILPRYAECLESGMWPGYDTEIQDIQWPKWASNF